MNKRINNKGKMALLVMLLVSSALLSGCRVGKTDVIFNAGLSNKDVFSINERICTLSEVKVFLTNYQNIYAKVYDVNLWEHDFGDNSLEAYVKDLTISQMAQMVSMNYLAEEQEISLDKNELSKVKEAAKAYYHSLSKEEIKYMDISQGTVEELYRQYGLANKLYAVLTKDVSDEVSDSEARVMEAVQIFVSNKNTAAEIKQKLEEGADFLTIASTYSEAAEKEITFGRGQMPEKVEEAAFSLEKDEVSGAIKTKDGYYFLKCVNNYNQELTDANRKEILEKRRKEAFDDIYEAFIKKLSSQFNQQLWDSIKVEIKDEITTKSFFETYEEYCKW